jgi:hypothetical protein
MSTPETGQQWRERMRRRDDELTRIFNEASEAGVLVPPTKEEFEQMCREEYGMGGAELFFPPRKI